MTKNNAIREKLDKAQELINEAIVESGGNCELIVDDEYFRFTALDADITLVSLKLKSTKEY